MPTFKIDNGRQQSLLTAILIVEHEPLRGRSLRLKIIAEVETAEQAGCRAATSRQMTCEGSNFTASPRTNARSTI